jgi:hypothetical protein
MQIEAANSWLAYSLRSHSMTCEWCAALWLSTAATRNTELVTERLPTTAAGALTVRSATACIATAEWRQTEGEPHSQTSNTEVQGYGTVLHSVSQLMPDDTER